MHLNENSQVFGQFRSRNQVPSLTKEQFLSLGICLADVPFQNMSSNKSTVDGEQQS